MQFYRFSLTEQSVLYAAKTLMGACLCWYGLIYCHVNNPIWAVITVIIVSDADLSATAKLAKARVINTVVGCLCGLISLSLFTYAPLTSLLTAAITVLLVTSIQHYPANWRLAPVTTVIVMDAGRQAVSKEAELLYALMRGAEIGIGCVVALVMAFVFSRLAPKIFAHPSQNQ